MVTLVKQLAAASHAEKICPETRSSSITLQQRQAMLYMFLAEEPHFEISEQAHTYCFITAARLMQAGNDALFERARLIETCHSTLPKQDLCHIRGISPAESRLLCCLSACNWPE